jgi:hypothetical protein
MKLKIVNLGISLILYCGILSLVPPSNQVVVGILLLALSLWKYFVGKLSMLK